MASHTTTKLHVGDSKILIGVLLYGSDVAYLSESSEAALLACVSPLMLHYVYLLESFDAALLAYLSPLRLRYLLT